MPTNWLNPEEESKCADRGLTGAVCKNPINNHSTYYALIKVRQRYK